jgi:hypothetical protein
MASIPNQPEEEFLEAKNEWNLENLELALECEKGDKLTPTANKYLRGVLCGYTPEDIGKKCNVTRKAVEVTLSREVSPYLKKILKLAENERINLSRVPHLLAKEKYKLEERSHSAEVLQRQEQAQEETPSKNTDFVGREDAIAHLNTLIASRNAKVIGIYGKGGVGKTKLAQQYFERYFEANGFKTLRLNVGTETRSITRVEGWLEDCLRLDFREELGQKFDFTRLLDRLRRQLQAQRVGLLIDNLEPALDENGKFIEPGYVQLLRVFAEPTVKSVTLLTSRERPKESKVTIEPYPLPELDEDAWREFFSRFEINVSSPTLIAMHKAYGGNALAMKFLSSAIQLDYDGDLEAYWHNNKAYLLKGDLKDLIASQFQRLYNHNYKSYNLLCRLGIYRYQEIPRVAILGVRCLLWDVLESERIHVIESLEHRYLVEFRKGEYWLHPMILAESRARLRESGESQGEILLSVKSEIDKLLADRELQDLLKQVKDKSLLVKTSDELILGWFGKSLKIPYKLAAVRFFYLNINLNLSRSLDLYYDLAGFRSVSGITLRFPLEKNLALDYYLTLVYHYACMGGGGDVEDNLARVHTLARILDSELAKSLHELEEKLRERQREFVEKLKKGYVFNENEMPRAIWRNWAEKLRAVVLDYRKIGYAWQFSNDQKKLLQQYYDVNKLLVDCLNNASDLSLKVRSHIEDTLLLPIAEIEKRRLGD